MQEPAPLTQYDIFQCCTMSQYFLSFRGQENSPCYDQSAFAFLSSFLMLGHLYFLTTVNPAAVNELTLVGLSFL